ncbi:MAG TPA: thioredoxin [Synechococcales cyanobacterium M55_K2018_004]|nr:thioredoxin [Synechococcales cyanobacterium M55_K2018_004]
MAVKKQFASFQEMLSESEVPILVDFYANWCGPCRLMAKILEEVNAEMRQRLKVVKIDSEAYPHLAEQYQINALPTLLLFKHGQVVDRIEGVMQARQLIQRLQAFV